MFLIQNNRGVIPGVLLKSTREVTKKSLRERLHEVLRNHHGYYLSVVLRSRMRPSSEMKVRESLRSNRE